MVGTVIRCAGTRVAIGALEVVRRTIAILSGVERFASRLTAAADSKGTARENAVDLRLELAGKRRSTAANLGRGLTAGALIAPGASRTTHAASTAGAHVAVTGVAITDITVTDVPVANITVADIPVTGVTVTDVAITGVTVADVAVAITTASAASGVIALSPARCSNGRHSHK